MIDLEKLKRVKRNAFWKIIKNHKRKNGKKSFKKKLILIDSAHFTLNYSLTI
jgi:hypothetical protein